MKEKTQLKEAQCKNAILGKLISCFLSPILKIILNWIIYRFFRGIYIYYDELIEQAT